MAISTPVKPTNVAGNKKGIQLSHQRACCTPSCLGSDKLGPSRQREGRGLSI